MPFPPETARIETEHLRKNELWSVIVTPSDGTDKGTPVHAELMTRNRPPGVPKIGFEVGAPKTSEGVKAKVIEEAVDPDRDALKYHYRWFRNGEQQSLAIDQTVIGAFLVKKGEKWKVRVAAFDGEVEGDAVEAELVIANTSPRAPAVAIEPKKPASRDDLTARIISEGVDDDNDPLTYRYVWKRSGAEFQPKGDPTRIPASELKRGDNWSVEVIPNDGEVDGASGTASAAVENSPPSTPVVRFKKWVPAVTDPIEIEVVEQATDIDGDKVDLKVRWEKNGQNAHEATNDLTLAAGTARKGEKWRVVITPHDGTVAGRPVDLFFEVANSPPLAPKVAIKPEAPKVTDSLVVEVIEPSRDVDGDAVVYRYRWFRNGELQSETTPKLAVGRARRSEHWRAEVTPFDGTIAGAVATGEVVVQNSQPTVPVLRVTPDPSRVADEIECRVETPPTDPDGDPLRVEVSWLRDGRPQRYPPDRFKLGRERGLRGSEWACEVRVSDGNATIKARAAGKQVNTAPTAPEIEIVPKVPLRPDTLSCEIRRESRDNDGDRIKYRYVWSVNGTPAVGLAENATQVPSKMLTAGQVWRCTVTPFDGTEDGAKAFTEITIHNSPPTAPRARVVPMVAKAGETLTCDVTQAATDVDGDPMQYRFYWKKNGADQNFATTSHQVPGRLVKYGTIWQCLVSAWDGKVEGKKGPSEPVQIERQ